MLRHFALWLALAAAIIFAGSGKALAQFSRSASIDLSSSSHGSGSSSFEHNPISRQFTFSGSFFGYSGYGSSSYARNNDNSIFGADGLYLTTDDGLQIRFGSIAQILSPAPSPMTSQIWTKTAKHHRAFALRCGWCGLSLNSVQRRGLSNRRTLNADPDYPFEDKKKSVKKSGGLLEL